MLKKLTEEKLSEVLEAGIREFADKGDPWGMWTAAFLCMNGMGTGIRYEEAYRLFERAADADNEEVRGLALYELGYMLANGYYERDSGKALECYRARLMLAVTDDGPLETEVPELTRMFLEEIVVHTPTEMTVGFLDGSRVSVRL